VAIGGLGLTAVLAAACGGTSHASSGGPSSSQALPVTVTSTAPTPKQTVTAARSTVTPSSAAAVAAVGACATSNLSITLVSAGGAGGTEFQTILFTNKGTTTCTLTAWPGVSYVSSAGAQVGMPAARRDNSTPSGTGGEPTTVTLRPGAEANAAIAQTNAATPSAATCKPEQASGVRIYPPNNTASVVVPIGSAGPSEVCTTTQYEDTVAPVVAGATGSSAA
jgi:hypothetical protein